MFFFVLIALFVGAFGCASLVYGFYSLWIGVIRKSKSTDGLWALAAGIAAWVIAIGFGYLAKFLGAPIQ